MHVQGVAAVSIAFLLLPGVAAAQKDAGKAPAPAGRWIMSRSARGIRATEAGVELRQGTGWVFTSAIFADFTLDLEFRIIDHGTRASLFVRAFPLERPTYGSYSIDLSDAVGGTTPLGSIASGKRDLLAQRGGDRGASRRDQATRHVAEPADHVRRPVDAGQPERHRGRSTERRGGSRRRARLGGRYGACRGAQPEDQRGRASAPADLVADPNRPLRPREGQVRGGAEARERRETRLRSERHAEKSAGFGIAEGDGYSGRNGPVGDVRVSRRFDREMDRVAIATVKQWRFTPAGMNGMPVDAIVEIEMSFTFR